MLVRLCRIRVAAPLVSVAAGLVLTLPAVAGAQNTPSTEDRYSLANGCFALTAPSGEAVTKAGGAYAVGGEAEPFRFQAVDLGRYLVMDRGGGFLAAGSGDALEAAAEPSAASEWRLSEARGARFMLMNERTGLGLATAGGGLVGQGPGEAFTPVEAQGCADYPEVEVNAKGKPYTGPTPYGETKGYLDAHMHMMAFEFLGGSAHCGRPWHPYGVAHALVDCPDHYPANGGAAVLENFVSFGNPAGTHDPVGWPTFKDWPNHASLTHETSYYKWVERAWRGGQRIFVNLMVDNAALCLIYPIKRYDCNEMATVRREIRDIYQLQDYIDAQWGGPGKGWYRIVTNPYQARRVINKGKLAVVLGIEISKLFDCGLKGGVPQCDREQIDRDLDAVYEMGVRDLELVNKFDNALGGVAGDGGTTGVLVNTGNFLDTGNFWDFETCTGPPEQADKQQLAIPGFGRDDLVGNAILGLVPPGTAPLYPDTEQCNTRGLSPLGAHVIDRMMEKGMIIDPDHLSVVARTQVLNQVEAAGYSGVVSSHSWGDEIAYERTYELGGVVTPYAGSSENFVEEWRRLREYRNPDHYFGFGWGADMNGFGAQGGPRNGPNPVSYPFKTFDGGTTLDRQRSGERVFDINADGVAHYGLYPDWVEDLRMQAGDRIVRDLTRGPEAYLQMWERAVGVPEAECRPKRAKLTASGLGRLRLRDSAKRALRRAGQPERRVGRLYRYCVAGKRNKRSGVVGVFTRGRKLGLVLSDARGHRTGGIAVGDSASRIEGAKRIASNVLTRRARGGARFVYRLGARRVRAVAVASPSANSKAEIRANLKLAR